MLYGFIHEDSIDAIQCDVLILIFLENALRQKTLEFLNSIVSLNPYFFGKCSTAATDMWYITLATTSLNPYFFGKCSTAHISMQRNGAIENSLNPYFFGKCSTAGNKIHNKAQKLPVLILIFLENALRQ